MSNRPQFSASAGFFRLLPRYGMALLALLVLLCAGSLRAGEVEVIKDVVYGKGGGEDLLLDLVKPKDNGGAPRPGIVFMHGGGWKGGDKDAGIWILETLARRGYVGVTINYRLTGKARWPAQIEDCKCAVRFLRAKAAEYDLDPDHIGTWGGSAGGHLAAMLGLTSGMKEFEGTGGWEGQSSSVQAVLAESGVFDLYAWKKNDPKGVWGMIRDLVGGDTEEFKDAMNKASPITYVSKTAPPFLVVSGDKDAVHFLSVDFSAALKAAGGTVEFVTVKDGGHGGVGWDATFNRTKAGGDFFDTHLRPAATRAPAPACAPDWREQVKTRKVVQPERDAGPWKFMAQPFPPIASVVAQQPDAVPLYGVYHWGEEYRLFRKEIKEVGWTSYRMGGFEDEEALIQAMEDGIEIMKVLTIGKTLQDLKDTGKRHAFASDEAFIGRYLDEVDAFCRTYGPGGSLFTKRPELAKQAVRHIELWNEPNFQYMIKDDPDRAKVMAERDRLYAKLLKQTCAMIKAKHPEVKTVAFSAGGASFDDVRFIKNVHELDPTLIGSYDILSTHPYTDTPPHADRVKSWGSYSVTGAWAAIHDILAKHGNPDKPIWYTEVGWVVQAKDVGAMFKDVPDYLPKPAMVQASCVVKLYALASRLGVRRVHIMSLTDADNFNSGFFTRSTKEWRPSAYAVQTMIRLLPKPRIQAALSEEAGGLYAYQFKSDWTKPDSREVVMVWQEQKKGDLRVSIPAGRKVAKLLNMLGGEETFTVNGNTVNFAGGPLPSYLVLE